MSGIVKSKTDVWALSAFIFFIIAKEQEANAIGQTIKTIENIPQEELVSLYNLLNSPADEANQVEEQQARETASLDPAEEAKEKIIEPKPDDSGSYDTKGRLDELRLSPELQEQLGADNSAFLLNRTPRQIAAIDKALARNDSLDNDPVIKDIMTSTFNPEDTAAERQQIVASHANLRNMVRSLNLNFAATVDDNHDSANRSVKNIKQADKVLSNEKVRTFLSPRTTPDLKNTPEPNQNQAFTEEINSTLNSMSQTTKSQELLQEKTATETITQIQDVLQPSSTAPTPTLNNIPPTA